MIEYNKIMKMKTTLEFSVGERSFIIKGIHPNGFVTILDLDNKQIVKSISNENSAIRFLKEFLTK